MLLSSMIRISYRLTRNTITPSGIEPPKIIPRSRMSKKPSGSEDSNTNWNHYNNTSFIEMFVHSGTHIDFPFHVYENGIRMDDFEIEDFVFDNPLLLELPKNKMSEIIKSDLVPHKTRLENTDLLLIYTGFSKYREKSPKKYEEEQPEFSAEATEYLVNNFPSIEAIGVDLLSIENIGKAKPNFPAHKVFLGGDRKFFMIEDMNLSPILDKNLTRVFVVPLILEGLEATPVTAFAEVQSKKEV